MDDPVAFPARFLVSGAQKPSGNGPLAERNDMDPSGRNTEILEKTPGRTSPLESQPEIVVLVAPFIRMADQKDLDCGITPEKEGILPQNPPVPTR